jgi:hypothetical protein
MQSALNELTQSKEGREPEKNEMKQSNDEIHSIFKKLCDLKNQSAILNAEIEVLENQLKSFIGESAGIEGVATWKSQIRKSFDQERFKQEHPDMFVRFSKEKPYRVFRLIGSSSSPNPS